jgi:hypothetical protein
MIGRAAVLRPPSFIRFVASIPSPFIPLPHHYTLSYLTRLTQQITDQVPEPLEAVVRPTRAAGNQELPHQRAKLQSNMATLVVLSMEMSDLVFEHLTTPDFIHFSETCKYLYAIALPLAYQHLTLTWYNTSERTRKNPDINILSSKLEADAELEESVRHLILKTYGCLSFSDDSEVRVSIPRSERKNFYEIVGNLVAYFKQLERLNYFEYLHTLRLEYSPAPALALEMLFRKRCNLRVFDVELYQCPAPYLDALAPFDLGRLNIGLDHVRETLTHLTIRYTARFEKICNPRKVQTNRLKSTTMLQ